MCCFSGPVKDVSATKIFARGGQGGREFVVYEMQFEAAADVAMILPLPVPAKSMEGDVRFLDLSEYEDFFSDLDRGFPIPRAAPALGGLGGGSFTDPKLAVVDVGEFEASFVPTVADFERLDARFRLPSDTWLKALPQYKDFGFAVFKLKSGHRKVHPMAFDFPRRNPQMLFFPTVHIHDGQVHETADFDHKLYLQATGTRRPLAGWRESTRPPAAFMKIDKTKGIVDPQAHVYRRELHGKLKNVDVVL